MIRFWDGGILLEYELFEVINGVKQPDMTADFFDLDKMTRFEMFDVVEDGQVVIPCYKCDDCDSLVADVQFWQDYEAIVGLPEDPSLQRMVLLNGLLTVWQGPGDDSDRLIGAYYKFEEAAAALHETALAYGDDNAYLLDENGMMMKD